MSLDGGRREEDLTYVNFRDRQTLATDQVQQDLGVTTNTWILIKGGKAIWLHCLGPRPSQVCAKNTEEEDGESNVFLYNFPSQNVEFQDVYTFKRAVFQV